MLDPRTLTHVQLATIVTDVQKILWQESKLIPDFPREMGDYWNPAKEEECGMLEQIADVLEEFDLKPPDCMPVDTTVYDEPKPLDVNELLWAARILNSFAVANCNTTPVARKNLELAYQIMDSIRSLPDFDPRDQRWTIKR
jgi:hypothetical protein